MTAPNAFTPPRRGLLRDSRLWILAALVLGVATGSAMVSIVHNSGRQRAAVRAVAVTTGERIAAGAAARLSSVGLETFAAVLPGVLPTGSNGADQLARLQASHRAAERCRCRLTFAVEAFFLNVRAGATLDTAALESDVRLPTADLARIAASPGERGGDRLRAPVHLVVDSALGDRVAITYAQAGDSASVIYGAVAVTKATMELLFGAGSRPAVITDSTVGLAGLDSLSLEITDGGGRVLFGALAPGRPYQARIGLHGPLEGLTLLLALEHSQVAYRIGALVSPNELWHLGLLSVGTILVIVLAVRSSQRDTLLARARSDFIAGVSHDLRMPLAQVLLAAETLELGRERDPAERHGLTGSIVREARRLIALVENILLFARSGTVELEPHLVPVPVPALFDDVIEVTRLAGLDARLSIEAPNRPDLSVRGDRPLLRQALANLVDNAIKYGRPGGHVRLTAERGSPGRIRLYIDDDGPGIPPSERDRVFDAYERLARDQGSERTGTGLGLAVVRYIVEACGGRVSLQDGPTGGTRAVVELEAS